MRKAKAPKRFVLPDPLHNSRLVSKAINMIMYEGKKSTAQSILYSAFALVEKKTKKPALEVFQTALNNISPVIELRVRRVAGSNYQVPTEVSKERKETLGLRWLILFSRKRNEKTMIEKLANEIIDASNNTGASIKKREETTRMAEANKAFAHLRF
ncbi:small subunit ribosomal protein S7 [Mycoplasmoides fastidiosum]|uniref:Small ribosomal subunit protein uS7 n=2 Tax=Mycoplasmoides fastidiosum TaxID=92758 RepID=A0ABU0LYZ5_9BACT|nr:30S ribosomal protein S7 [Mycoplasmoides fastidiosum]MDQ0513924.1 small subunit ribosomal protein S7 [Mycoplasmoides fastidiosum]UUD37662.1 30S ribosomal protein S7 [Mycoplasmoides fastidiosum]